MRLTLWPALRRFIWKYVLLQPIARRIRGHLAPSSPFVASYIDHMRQRPLVFGTWVQLRRIRFLITGTRRRRNRLTVPLDNANLTDIVLPYNKDGWWSIQRERTERLINILRSVRELDAKNSKLLCIGPRNEAELLLMSTYGFTLKNIRAIDLFSFSPLIEVMDMHEMKFGDSQFDIVYSAYVLGYSDDVPRACSEAIRVCKEGGLFATVFLKTGSDAPHVRTNWDGGLAELFGHFNGHIKHIYWQEEAPRGDETICSTIFSISK